jgi:hypothetical protein
MSDSKVMQYLRQLDADQTGGQAVEIPGKRMARLLARGGVSPDDVTFLYYLYRACFCGDSPSEPTPEEETRANRIIPIGWPANNFTSLLPSLLPAKIVALLRHHNISVSQAEEVWKRQAGFCAECSEPLGENSHVSLHHDDNRTPFVHRFLCSDCEEAELRRMLERFAKDIGGTVL